MGHDPCTRNSAPRIAHQGADVESAREPVTALHMSWSRFNPSALPIWLLVGIAWCVVRLPLPVLMRVGVCIGWLGHGLAKRRVHITDVNLRLCFPELAEHERHALRKRVFRSTGIALIETAMAWLAPVKQLRARAHIHGLELIAEAQAAGHGVLLLGAHFSTLDIAGALLAEQLNLDVMYRYNKNPAIEALMRRGRARLYGGVLERGDVRTALRRLRDGHVLWYAVDQDFGRKHSVFAPFFGVPAASLTAAARFAKAGNARVLFFSHFRGESPWRWELHIQALPAAFPSGDAVHDASLVNAMIESQIRIAPEQYLWLHRRFKTRPLGEARPY